MEIKVASTAGFCFGVSRAVETVYRYIEEHPGQKIYTCGPIVHNGQVVEDLSAKGVSVIADDAGLDRLIRDGALKDAAVIIRAHGIGSDIREKLESVNGICVIDATCPYVTKIHEVVRKAYEKGDMIVITGDPDHPEVKGIMGCVGGNAAVIADTLDAERFSCPEGRRITLVSQTTFNVRKFEDIVEIFKKKMYIVSIVNTICNATQRRQSEAAALSRECDVMLVVGGSNSSNTAKLFEICRSECQATYYIRCLDDLSRVAIGNSVRCIGITAGASTPKTIIEEVLNYVRTEFW